MSIDELIDEYLASKSLECAQKTMRWYTYHLNTLGRWCSTNAVSEARVLVTPQVLARVYREVHLTNENSLHGYMQVVRGFLRWCAGDEELRIKDAHIRRIRLKQPKEEDIQILSPQEIKNLLKTCEQNPYPLRDAALFRVMLDTGVRLSELVYDSSAEYASGLRTGNLHLSRRGRRGEGFIVVRGKGNKERSVNLGMQSEVCLRGYLNRGRGRDESDYVFLSRTGAPLGARMVEQLCSDLGGKIGRPDLHPHLFRHTFAVNALLSGTPELLLCRILGHESLAATRKYVRAVSMLQARGAVRSLVDRTNS